MLKRLCKLRCKNGFTIVELIVVIAIIAILSAIGIPAYLDSTRKASVKTGNESASSFYFALQQTLTPYLAKDGTADEFGLVTSTGPSYVVPAGQMIKRITPNTGAFFVSNPQYSSMKNFIAGTKFFVYAEVGANGKISYIDLNFTSWGSYMTKNDASLRANLNSSVLSSFVDYTAFPATPTQNQLLLDDIVKGVEGYLKTAKIDSGYYYASFDSDMRVSMTYYSKAADRERAYGPGGAGARHYLFEAVDNEINGFVFGAYPNEFGMVMTRQYQHNERQWFSVKNNVNDTGTDIVL